MISSITASSPSRFRAGYDDTWRAVRHDTPGKLRICGLVYDGDNQTNADHLIETWQADPHGRVPSAAILRDPFALAGRRETARCAPTTAGGYWEIETVKPGPVSGVADTTSAPHIDLCLWLQSTCGLITRVYFADEADANAADALLQALPPSQRETLLAEPTPDGYRFDIHLSGAQQTAFLSVAA